MVEYPKTSDRLPSWVFVLNTTGRDYILCNVTVTSTRPFAATGSTSHLPPLASEIPYTLTCHSVVLDRVKEDDVSRWPLCALLPCSDIITYIAAPMLSNHPHATSPAHRAEAAWRIPVVNHEYTDASIGTS